MRRRSLPGRLESAAWTEKSTRMARRGQHMGEGMGPVRQRVALLSAALVMAAAVSACGDGDAKPDIARPRLEDGQIVFPEGSAQVSSFATDSVKASGPLQLRLTGRLVWDENRTVRLYPPFAGRVVQIVVKIGEHVGKGQ